MEKLKVNDKVKLVSDYYGDRVDNPVWGGSQGKIHGDWRIGDIGVIYKIEDWQGITVYYLKGNKNQREDIWHIRQGLKKVNIINYNLFKEIED